MSRFLGGTDGIYSYNWAETRTVKPPSGTPTEIDQTPPATDDPVTKFLQAQKEYYEASAA